MKPISYFIVAGLFMGGGIAAASPIDGEWMTPGGWSKVRIGACERNRQQICGNIVWLKNPNNAQGQPKLDTSNPNPVLRNRPLVGLPFIYGFSGSGKNRWSGGKIYDPGSGKTYKSKLSINPDGTLNVEGCVLFICKSQTWKRPA